MTISERKAALLARSVESLAEEMLNDEYYRFISARADYAEDEQAVDGEAQNGRAHMKRVPYIGFYWRRTDFFHGRITIGFGPKYVGVMESNKWGYPERDATPAEVEQIVAIVDAAMEAASRGGLAEEIVRNTNRELERLWPLFQSFPKETA